MGMYIGVLLVKTQASFWCEWTALWRAGSLEKWDKKRVKIRLNPYVFRMLLLLYCCCL